MPMNERRGASLSTIPSVNLRAHIAPASMFKL
jgi:hypothetical protein